MSDTRPAGPPRFGWWFLLVVTMIYGAVAILDSDVALRGLQHTLEAVWKMLPALVLVFVVIWAFHFVSGLQKRLSWLSGSEGGAIPWVVAVSTGVLAHGPIYPWYPLLRELRGQGVRTGLIAAFLYARAIKLPWLPLMAHYFGLGYTVALTAYIVLFAFITGRVVESLTARRPARDA